MQFRAAFRGPLHGVRRYGKRVRSSGLRRSSRLAATQKQGPAHCRPFFLERTTRLGQCSSGPRSADPCTGSGDTESGFGPPGCAGVLASRQLKSKDRLTAGPSPWSERRGSGSAVPGRVPRTPARGPEIRKAGSVLRAAPEFSPRGNSKARTGSLPALPLGANDEARTRYLHLGKVALYRMSYVRNTLMQVLL